MRRLFTLLLLCVLTVGFVGCGGGRRMGTPEEDTATQAPSEMPSTQDALSGSGEKAPTP
jgi:hypothetical protein